MANIATPPADVPEVWNEGKKSDPDAESPITLFEFTQSIRDTFLPPSWIKEDTSPSQSVRSNTLSTSGTGNIVTLTSEESLHNPGVV